MAKALDLDLLEENGNIDKSVSYGTESKKDKAPAKQLEAKSDGTTITKRIPWKTLKGRRVTVRAFDTILWDGNPRNFQNPGNGEEEHEVDVSDLLPKIKVTGGNSQAVDARMVDGKIQVIAGKRRRLSCGKLDLELTCDVYDDVSDEDATYIAKIENEGRKDIDLLTMSTYLHHRFKEQKEVNSNLTIEAFASKFEMSERTMLDRFRLAKLPEWIKDSCVDRHSWTVRQANSLAALCEQLKSYSCYLSAFEEGKRFKLSTPSLVLTKLKSYLPSTEESKDKSLEDMNITSTSNVDYKLAFSKKGEVTVKSKAKLTDEQLSKLKEFLQSL